MTASTLDAAVPTSHQNARFAIDGAMDYGRLGINKPPSDDHWLMQYWLIGQRLAQLSRAFTPALPHMFQRAADFHDSRPTVPNHGRRAADGATIAVAKTADELLQRWDRCEVIGPALVDETIAFLRTLAAAANQQVVHDMAVTGND